MTGETNYFNKPICVYWLCATGPDPNPSMIRIQVCIVICGDQKGPPAKRPSESITLLFFRINESIKIYLVFGQLFLGKSHSYSYVCCSIPWRTWSAQIGGTWSCFVLLHYPIMGWRWACYCAPINSGESKIPLLVQYLNSYQEYQVYLNIHEVSCTWC